MEAVPVKITAAATNEPSKDICRAPAGALQISLPVVTLLLDAGWASLTVCDVLNIKCSTLSNMRSTYVVVVFACLES